MYGCAFGGVLDGVDGLVIRVEADVSPGLPQFSIVGLPDSAVQESKLRIRSAIRNAGLEFPNRRITVNLSPASLRKRGAGLDLAIAIAILRAAHILPETEALAWSFVAELSLAGTLTPVHGLINLGLAFRHQQIPAAVVPRAQVDHCLPVPGLTWIACDTLAEVISVLRHPASARQLAVTATRPWLPADTEIDMADLSGMREIKRALTIAAAGRHHALLVGPPGCGKTSAAERFATILPDLTEMQALEVHAIYQAAGLRPPQSLRPVTRAPHHSVTAAGLIGGGSQLSPGEATLAHHGVLFLDELLEFQRPVLDSIREPLTHRCIRLTRNGRSTRLPADFILIAACNPCPCGQRGFGECRCTARAVARYWSNLSGPLLDRIDMLIPFPPAASHPQPPSETSAELRERVTAGRQRLCATTSPLARGDIPVDPPAARLLERAVPALRLSRRGQAAVLGIARTIAALDGEEVVRPMHLHEALGLRMPPPGMSTSEQA